MTPTVHDLRNDIRVAVDRFEREIAADFTKEDLAAICAALADDVGGKPLPPKPEMRASILAAIGEPAADTDRPLRKAELEVVLGALDDE